MSENYVNEIEVIYKPRLDLKQLTKVSNNYQILDFLKEIWADDIEYRERFYAVYLNRQNNILGYYLISAGGCSGTFIDLKLIFQPALKLHASSIIIAHNHPSGSLKPSEQDLQMTKKIVEAGKILAIPILDHIILTVSNHYSFLNNNQL